MQYIPPQSCGIAHLPLFDFEAFSLFAENYDISNTDILASCEKNCEVRETIPQPNLVFDFCLDCLEIISIPNCSSLEDHFATFQTWTRGWGKFSSWNHIDISSVFMPYVRNMMIMMMLHQGGKPMVKRVIKAALNQTQMIPWQTCGRHGSMKASSMNYWNITQSRYENGWLEMVFDANAAHRETYKCVLRYIWCYKITSLSIMIR